MSYEQFKNLLRVKIYLESVGFEHLTNLDPILCTKMTVFRSDFHQEDVKRRGQT